MLKINEIYKSIQGESRFAGEPCVFIRLTGCNLRCSWCDTKYAYYKGREVSIKQVMDKISALHCKLVQVTGGEPLLQQETHQLIKQLVKKGFRVMIGTNGSQDISKIDKRVVKLVDIKCPGSGESGKTLWGNLKYLTKNDEVKFVLSGRKDYDWAKKVTQKYELAGKTRVVFGAAYGKLSLKLLSGWILNDGIDARLGFQLHKYVWGADAKSV